MQTSIHGEAPPAGPPAMVLALALVLPLAAALAQPDEVARAELRAVRTVRIEVKQTYDFSADVDESVAPAASPDGKGFLPLLPLATEIVKFTSWRVVPAGAPAELAVRIEVEGRALGADYTGTISGYQYTGAAIAGTATFDLGGRPLLEHAFEGEASPPFSINSYHGTPASAPFSRTLPSYCAGLWTAVGQALGPAPLVAGIQRGSDEVKAGARRALLGVCDETTRPTFRAMLGSRDDQDLARLGALGLGAVGDVDDIPLLLDALRRAGEAPGAEPGDRRAWLEIEFWRESPDDRRAMAQEFLHNGFSDRRRPLLWALQQLDAPDRIERFAAAARTGEHAAFRANAVLLLGWAEEPAAQALVEGALADPDPLVRAAALCGLANRTDDRLADPILRLTGDADATVRVLARERLELLAEGPWSAYRRAVALASSDVAAENAEFMAAAFAHQDPLIRTRALALARDLPGQPHRAVICRMAREDSWAFLREQAVEALKNDRDTVALEVLAAALQDPEIPVREAALAALSGDSADWEQSSPPRLPEAVIEPALALARADDGRHAGRAISILGRAGGMVSTQALERLARGPGPEETRSLAIGTLVRTRPSSTAPLLVELAGAATGGTMDEAVINGLVELSHPATLDPLIVLLRSGPLESRRLVARALGGMRQPRAVGPLIAALQVAEGPGAGQDEALAEAARSSLQLLTGAWHHGAAEWRAWWKENSVRAPAQ